MSGTFTRTLVFFIKKKKKPSGDREVEVEPLRVYISIKSVLRQKIQGPFTIKGQCMGNGDGKEQGKAMTVSTRLYNTTKFKLILGLHFRIRL